MISSLKFRINFWPNDVVDLLFDYNKGLLSYTGVIEDPLFLDTQLEGHYKGNGTQWVERLDELNLSGWREVYNSTTSGHVSWKMDLYERGQKPRHLQGKDAFPDNFEAFIGLLKEAVPEAAEDLDKWEDFGKKESRD